jgi:hypothetical protein
MSQSNGSTQSASPPKVRLTFRVGVVGHRPHRLRREDIPSLARRLGEVLSSVKKAVQDFSATHSDLYNKEAPCLRAISPLAEGTDRYFAREALKLGYQLCCPLPFHEEEFENDFKPPHSLEPDIDSVADFNNILADARTMGDVRIFELDGRRSEAAEAYAAAGRVVLNQSDLLVVVWDGGGENKRGGTYETLKEAIGFAVPVLWIDPRSPHHAQLLLTQEDLPVCDKQRCVPVNDEDLNSKLCGIVQHVLAPPGLVEPQPSESGRTVDLRSAYFSEKRPKINVFVAWKLFRDFVGSFRRRIPSMKVPRFEDAVAPDWPISDINDVASWINSRLRAHYAWSDKLADLYADRYRSSFVIAYLFGAVAVILALLTHTIPRLLPHMLSRTFAASRISIISTISTVTGSVMEFAVITIILGLVYFGNKRHWHQRWMDYRLIAELVRQLRFLIPLGGARPFPRLPPFLSFGNPINSWMYWHLRSIDRSVGLPNAKLTASYLGDCITYISHVIDGQIEFHEVAAKRSERIEHRLHTGGFICFCLAGAAAFAHFLLPEQESLGADMILLAAAGFPAVGAALAAISNQAEFARITKRSRAMASRLRQDLQVLSDAAPSQSGEIAKRSLILAQTMVDEVLDWRLVFLDRPLVTPG